MSAGQHCHVKYLYSKAVEYDHHFWEAYDIVSTLKIGKKFRDDCVFRKTDHRVALSMKSDVHKQYTKDSSDLVPLWYYSVSLPNSVLHAWVIHAFICGCVTNCPPSERSLRKIGNGNLLLT